MPNNYFEHLDFRLGKPEDAEKIGILAQQVFRDNYANHAVREDLVEEVMLNYAPELFEQRISSNTSRFELVEEQGKLVAFSECETAPEYSHADLSLSDGVELVRLYVHRSKQSQGIGRELISQVEVYTQSLAKPFIWLFAWSKNYNTENFTKLKAIEMWVQRTGFTKMMYLSIAFTKRSL